MAWNMADPSAFVEDQGRQLQFILEWGGSVPLDGATDTTADVFRLVDERS